MTPEGVPAPDFTATTTDGTVVTLSHFQGSNNVVLFFYPEDDTPGCTREACGFRDAKPEYDAADTVIFGVSLDDQASHQAFTEKFSLNFPLLVDSGGEICAAYGVPVNNRWPKRVTFLVNKEGIISKVWEQVHVAAHATEVLQELLTPKKVE
ncbi:MAG: peroxiredoxin [Chlorobi bacterium CHB2]|nr:peroxiredoxin [Chlorobi bacterium CHB2]